MGDVAAARRHAVGVAVQAQVVAGARLDDPCVAGQQGAAAEQPAGDGKGFGVGGRFGEHRIFPQQVPRVLAKLGAGRLGRPVVAYRHAVALLAGRDDRAPQAPHEILRDAHLLARDHGDAVGVEFQGVLDEIVLVQRPHHTASVSGHAPSVAMSIAFSLLPSGANYSASGANYSAAGANQASLPPAKNRPACGVAVPAGTVDSGTTVRLNGAHSFLT